MRFGKPTKTTAAVATVVAATFPVAACGGDSHDVSDKSSASEQATPAKVLDEKNGCERSVMALPAGVTPDSGMSADHVSPSGEYVVGTADNQPILWHDGEPEIMGDGMANHGHVGVTSTGTVLNETDNQVYRDGKATVLKAAADVTLTGINDSGVIIGNRTRTVYDSEEQTYIPTVPMRWRDGEAEKLDLEPGKRGAALAITEDGTVLGFQTDKDSDDQYAGTPWKWSPDGDGEALPDPYDKHAAFPVDTAGDWVLAKVAGRDDAYRWRLSDPSDVEKLDALSEPVAIDEAGRVYDDLLDGPVIQDKKDIVDLPGDILSNIKDANADGSVLVGNRINDEPDVGDDVLMWTCEH